MILVRILANLRLGVMSGLRSAQWPRILASARPHYLPITTTISTQISLATAAAALTLPFVHVHANETFAFYVISGQMWNNATFCIY